MATKIDYDPLNPVSVSERQNALERYLNVENEFMAAEGYAKSKEATLRKLAVRVIVEVSVLMKFFSWKMCMRRK